MRAKLGTNALGTPRLQRCDRLRFFPRSWSRDDLVAVPQHKEQKRSRRSPPVGDEAPEGRRSTHGQGASSSLSGIPPLSDHLGVATQQLGAAVSSLHGLHKDPYRNACANDAGLATANVGTYVDTGKSVAQIAHNPLKDFCFLPFSFSNRSTQSGGGSHEPERLLWLFLCD